MIDASRGGNGAGHRGMRDDELQNDLCPARALDLRSPGRQRTPGKLPGQLALPKWPVDDDGDASFLSQWENAAFDLAVEDVVSHLHEIDGVGAHDLLDLAVTSTFRSGDTNVAHLSSGL